MNGTGKVTSKNYHVFLTCDHAQAVIVHTALNEMQRSWCERWVIHFHLHTTRCMLKCKH